MLEASDSPAPAPFFPHPAPMQLVAAGVAVLSAVLYASADIASPEHVAARLPPGLDDRLAALVSGVRVGMGRGALAAASQAPWPLF